LALLFSARFLLDISKENQGSFESQFPLNMGQVLSIPFVLLGLYFIWRRPVEVIHLDDLIGEF
jgi:phosphatidylglycerol:prolipoprotein diacylglycerol transferase